MKILIVDDEAPARQRLIDLLGECAGPHTVVEADNGLSALQAAQRERPDLVLLDIRMPVMDGLEAACHLAGLDPPPALVFTTAYQDHAIEAFEANAADYLLKPIRRERLQQALDKARVLNLARLNLLRTSDPGGGARTHLSTTHLGRIELIPVQEIGYLRAEQKYVVIGWQGREVLIDEPLKSLEEEFPGRFLRVHRNALVALDFIQALDRDPGGGYFLRLRDGADRIAVSRRHLREVRRVMKRPGRPA